MSTNNDNNNKTKLRIVLPGGGLKAAYSYGVMDILYNSEKFNEKYEIDTIIGTSSGAIIGFSYLLDGLDSIRDYFMDISSQSDIFKSWFNVPFLSFIYDYFFSPTNTNSSNYLDLLSGLYYGSLYDYSDNLDNFYDDLQKKIDQIIETDDKGINLLGKFYCTMMDIKTFKLVYIRGTSYDIINYLKASQSIPLIYPTINILGGNFTDGAILEPIPFAVNAPSIRIPEALDSSNYDGEYLLIRPEADVMGDNRFLPPNNIVEYVIFLTDMISKFSEQRDFSRLNGVIDPSRINTIQIDENIILDPIVVNEQEITYTIAKGREDGRTFVDNLDSNSLELSINSIKHNRKEYSFSKDFNAPTKSNIDIGDRKKIRIVLPSSGTSSVFQAGFMTRLIEEEDFNSKYFVDGIYGVSVGALLGAYVATGQMDQIRRISNQTNSDVIFKEWNSTPLVGWIISIINGINNNGMYNPELVDKLVDELRTDRLERTEDYVGLNNFYCTVTDYENGRPMYIRGNDPNIKDFIRAGMRFWIIYPPISINDRLYLEGSLFEHLTFGPDFREYDGEYLMVRANNARDYSSGNSLFELLNNALVLINASAINFEIEDLKEIREVLGDRLTEIELREIVFNNAFDYALNKIQYALILGQLYVDEYLKNLE